MKKVLIVDDIEENRYLLKSLLEGSGFEVLCAENGMEALEKARRSPPDVVISDILMPTMDGFSLLREWKKDDTLKNIPFVIYTATYTDPGDETLALRLGAARFIVKPIETEIFIAAITQVMEDWEKGNISTPSCTVDDDAVYYRMYNESLIRKLEKKMLALEQAMTARSHDKESLAFALKEWQTTFDAIADGICLLDKERKITRYNRAFVRYVQKPEGEIIGRYCWQVVHGTDEPLPECPAERVLKSLRRESRDVELSNYVFEVSVDPILDSSGSFCGAVHIMRDITELKKNEQTLRSQLDELRRWQMVILNREDRVIELKKEINELCKKLDIPLRYGPNGP